MRQVDAEAREEQRNRRVGEFVQALTQGRGATGVPGGRVTRITMRLPTEASPETLLVVKAIGDDGDVVAFVGGLDVVQALLTWRARDRKDGLKWREDKPWGGT